MPYGFAGFIGFAEETTWGTPVGVNSGDFIEAMSENVTLAIDRYEARNIVGRFVEGDDFAGTRRIVGDLVFPAHPLHLGRFLKANFGNISTVTVVLSGFLWEVDFRPATADAAANNPLPPLTLEIFRDVTSSNRYAGAQVTKLGLSVQPNQDLRATASILAKTTSMVAKSTPTYPATGTNPFVFDTASVQIAGSAVDYVESLAIEFDNQLEGIPVLNNSTDIARVRRRGAQQIRVRGTVGFETAAEYGRFTQQSEANLVASWAQTNSFGLVLRVPRLIYTAFPLGMPGDQRLTVAFEGMGRFDATLGFALQARLTTVKSNY
jgi:hypothetical protein